MNNEVVWILTSGIIILTIYIIYIHHKIVKMHNDSKKTDLKTWEVDRCFSHIEHLIGKDNILTYDILRIKVAIFQMVLGANNEEVKDILVGRVSDEAIKKEAQNLTNAMVKGGVIPKTWKMKED